MTAHGVSRTGNAHTVTENCPLAKYIHELGPVGKLVTLSVNVAARKLHLKEHTIHSEIRDLRAVGMILAEPDSRAGAYTVRILR